MANSFQFTRTARLVLAHRKHETPAWRRPDLSEINNSGAEGFSPVNSTAEALDSLMTILCGLPDVGGFFVFSV
jgi:hypothetical protein